MIEQVWTMRIVKFDSVDRDRTFLFADVFVLAGYLIRRDSPSRLFDSRTGPQHRVVTDALKRIDFTEASVTLIAAVPADNQRVIKRCAATQFRPNNNNNQNDKSEFCARSRIVGISKPRQRGRPAKWIIYFVNRRRAVLIRWSINESTPCDAICSSVCSLMRWKFVYAEDSSPYLCREWFTLSRSMVFAIWSPEAVTR